MNNNITMTLNVDDLILSALREDISSEDVSTNAVMPKAQKGQAQLICKQDGVLAGLFVFQRVFELLDSDIEVSFLFTDGDKVKKGELIGTIVGDIRAILSGERTALNYLQRMSGIATYTNSIASLLEGSKMKLLDTRKTTPNNRIFEKYAVKTGGGYNHRYNLSDGVLLKDNHIGAAGGVKEAVKMAPGRSAMPGPAWPASSPFRGGWACVRRSSCSSTASASPNAPSASRDRRACASLASTRPTARITCSST